MAGSQFRFFLTGPDEEVFEEAIRKSGDVAFLELWPPAPRAMEIPTSVVSQMGSEVLTILISRRNDMKDISFEEISGTKKYYCDLHEQPVVEFARCYVSREFIRPGRLFRYDSFINVGGRKVDKSAEFVDWASRLYRLAKSSLHRVGPMFYAGREAMKRREYGLLFEGVDVQLGKFTR